ncbi:hypothetical protein Hypma_011247 [Hypsizygus marmoreus]|uniref:DUF6534 domain-containing protein n=1 Tax=Hypsizygus marmoreus TaxID=39966 RepID=A0A369JQD6_HYPMA|nr:hypothetical protein Hypma_011247 [Hypsizygus marmoreus]
MSSVSSMDIPKTFGALLLGGVFAAVLSGVVAIQVIIYYKLYPDDSPRLKLLVFFVWFLDTCHTGFVWAALWDYLIAYYGDFSRIDFIPWHLATTIAFTAVLTFAVHCFFARRILLLSHRNWFLTIGILILAVLRLISACATTGEMINLHSFTEFKAKFTWLFTLGLSLSSAVDIIITGALSFFLHTSRSGTTNLNVVIDSLIRYAFETGFLTMAGTIVSMICWVSMPGNLIFMGLHFVISKLYSNSLLVTLNMRENLRRTRHQPSFGDRDFPTILRLDTRGKRLPGSDLEEGSVQSPASHDYQGHTTSKGFLGKVEISVERSVQRDTSDDPVLFKTSRG